MLKGGACVSRCSAQIFLTKLSNSSTKQVQCVKVWQTGSLIPSGSSGPLLACLGNETIQLSPASTPVLPWRWYLSRKYSQKGYQDSGVEKTLRTAPSPARPREETFGPRPIQMPGSRSVSRCAMCGSILQEQAEGIGQCTKCRAELHSCRQCNSFDPGARFECSQPVNGRVENKTARNDCRFFSLRIKLEKETTTSPAKISDARAAFDRLFKK